MTSAPSRVLSIDVLRGLTIATTLIGCVTGLWLRTNRARIVAETDHAQGGSVTGLWLGTNRVPHARRGFFAPIMGLFSSEPTTHRLVSLLIAGLTSLLSGLLWSPSFPINKNLWTSSYVLFAAGLSLLLLALFYWLIDIRRFNGNPATRWLLRPWLIFGSNAITAFVVSNFLVELALWIKIPAGALINPADPTQPISTWLWTYRHLFARHTSTEVTSLAFALAFTALSFLPNWLLWRRKIFLKI